MTEQQCREDFTLVQNHEPPASMRSKRFLSIGNQCNPTRMSLPLSSISAVVLGVVIGSFYEAVRPGSVWIKHSQVLNASQGELGRVMLF